MRIGGPTAELVGDLERGGAAETTGNVGAADQALADKVDAAGESASFDFGAD